MASLPAEHLNQLKAFVKLLQATPTILHTPELKFFKEYIESFGGKVPTETEAPPSFDFPKPEYSEPPRFTEPSPNAHVDEVEEDLIESDVEFDDSGVIEPDSDEPQNMGDADKVVSEDDMEKSDDKKREAISAFSEGEFDKAIGLYTEAIGLNPGSALLYAKRGQCYIKLNKPNACIRDCSRALEINPDSAAAYKFRGRAHRLLGHWEDAAKDLRNACKIDFDEQADEWLREVTPNARKAEEHKLKYERLHRERELKEKQERLRRVREEHAKAAKAQPPRDDFDDAAGMGDFSKLFDDDLMAAFQDPEVAAAFADISANPANIMKYQDNPKVSALIKKMTAKFGMGGMGGMSGMGGMGGMGGMPNMDNMPGMGAAFGGTGAPFGGSAAPPSAPDNDDVGLD